MRQSTKMQRCEAGFVGLKANPDTDWLKALAGSGARRRFDANRRWHQTRTTGPAATSRSCWPGKGRRLDCYRVVVPDFNTAPGVVTDLQKGIVAKRSGPLDCALIRYN